MVMAMAEYIFTVKDRLTDEILCQGSSEECAEAINCDPNYFRKMARTGHKYTTNSKYSKYIVERQVFGEAKRGGARTKDVICCDCGLLMKKVSTKRKRCPECARKHKNMVNAQRLRETRGTAPRLTPIRNPNAKFCDGCVFFGGDYEGSRSCNYIFIKGKRRPCPPGKGCTVKIDRGKNRAKEERCTDIS